MSRTLSAHQTIRARSSEAKAIQIVKLVAYSDFYAKTISSTFYWATSAIRYDYANTGTVQEIPALLIGISPLVSSMPHLPNPREIDTRTLTITISNEDFLQGFTYIAAGGSLQGEFNLLGASIELSELLIDDFGIPFTDLSALVGD